VFRGGVCEVRAAIFSKRVYTGQSMGAVAMHIDRTVNQQLDLKQNTENIP
jgi:hypothetical protein